MNDLTLHRLAADDGQGRPHNSMMMKDQPTFWERLFPREKWTRIAIAWSVSQFIIISVLEGFILKTHNAYVESLSTVKFPVDPATGEPPNIVPNSRALIVYQALFICAQAFQLFLCLDAIYSLSVIQLASTALFNFALFVYSVIQYTQAANLLSSLDLANLAKLAPTLTPHPTKLLEYIVIGLMSMFAIGWGLLAVKLYRVFGWTIYKEIGADVSILKSLRIYHIYLMLLKLDVFFFFGFDVQFLVLVLINQQDDLTSLIVHAAVAIPLSIILLAVAYYGVRFENKILTSVTLIGLLGAVSYLATKLVDIWTTTDRNKYLSSKRSLTFFVCLTIFMCLITFVFAILNFMQFGRGLKEKLNNPSQRRNSLIY